MEEEVFITLATICIRLSSAGWRRRWRRGKPPSSVSLSFISCSSGARFPRVPHFQISYLGPVLSISLIFLHVICMQLIKPAPFPSPLRRQSSLLHPPPPPPAGRMWSEHLIRPNERCKDVREALRGSSRGKVHLCVSVRRVLIFICSPFLLCIFGGFTQWPLCLGQWVHPSNPPYTERNPFPVEIEEEKREGGWMKGWERKGCRRDWKRRREEEDGLDDGMRDSVNQRMNERWLERSGQEQSRLLDSRRLLETLSGLWDRLWDHL